MALFNTLRNKMGKVVVGLIAFSIMAFVGADLLGPNSTLLGGNNTDVGEIAGKTISYQDYVNKIDEMTINFRINSQRNPSSNEMISVRNQAWDALINDIAYKAQFKKIGVDVTNDEVIDMVQGNNVSPEIKQAFTNPETGQFDKQQVINFLQELRDVPPAQRANWLSFEQNLAPARTRTKYENLLIKSNYASLEEGKQMYYYTAASADVKYVYVPFNSIVDSTVKVTDSELQDYIKKNEKQFQKEESRGLKFVSIKITPSAKDTAVVLDQISLIKENLIEAEDDSTFAVINSDGNFPFITYNRDDVPESLTEDGVLVTEGTVTGPFLENNKYVVYKLSGISEGTETVTNLSYKVTKIELELYVSDETRNNFYREAETFAMNSNDIASFEENAKENSYKVIDAKQIKNNDRRVSNLQNARGIVTWLYNTGEVGKVSDVFELDNDYIIAVMTNLQEKGVSSLESVRNQVERKVKDAKKATQIISKLGSADGTLDDIAQAYGADAKVITMNNLKLSGNTLTTVGLAPEAVGLAFSMENGEKTKPFKVENGVLVLELVNKIEPAEISDYESYRAQAEQKRQGRIPYNINETVKELAKIEDLRYKFF